MTAERTNAAEQTAFKDSPDEESFFPRTVSTQEIVEKIQDVGTPLRDWGAKIHYGIGAEYRKTFVVKGASDEGKYVCAVLNSALARWFLTHAPSEGGAQPHIECLPIPRVDADEQRGYAKVVDKILASKAADPQADTSELETELDWYVYYQYKLTPYEVDYVTGGTLEEEDLVDHGLLMMMDEAKTEENIGYEEVEKALQKWDEDRY